jgi:hypothetical protein
MYVSMYFYACMYLKVAEPSLRPASISVASPMHISAWHNIQRVVCVCVCVFVLCVYVRARACLCCDFARVFGLNQMSG